MNVLETVAGILKAEGVEWVSCFPSNELIEAVAGEGIRTVMFRQERGAIMAADGFSRVNDRAKFGVVITQGGPGGENSMGGLAQAFADNVPILYFTAGPPLESLRRAAGFLTGAHLSDRLQTRRGHRPSQSSSQHDAAGLSCAA